MLGSFRIGKILGIDVGIHWSWLFIFALVTWSFADGILQEFFPQWSTAQKWIVGGIVAGIFFISILLHEISHSLVARAKGIPVRDITLFVFGGVSNLGHEARSAGEEFQIAIVGPLTSLALAAFFAVLWLALQPFYEGAAAVAGYLAFINLILAVFNMLPGFPLDGGRVFRSIVWARNRDQLRATRIAAKVGEFLSYGLMGVGVIQIFFGNFAGGIWMILVGTFLRGASVSSYENLLVEQTLSGVKVRDVARQDYAAVPPDITIQQLVTDYVLNARGRSFPVVAGQELLGLITLTDVQRLGREQWPVTSVYRAMTPVDRLRTVGPDEDVMQVLQMMIASDVNQVPVIDGRLIAGMVSRGDIFQMLQARQAVGARP
jgi:Zn-dependent protease/CBS domain-containing protein